ncbi:MAG: SUF system NifU family Fe-S cluster assembly protein, partial [Ilumatobacter sp.]
AVIRRFKSMMGVDDQDADTTDDDIDLGDLEALQGVVKFPVRIKCAVLSWNTLANALEEALAPAD